MKINIQRLKFSFWQPFWLKLVLFLIPWDAANAHHHPCPVIMWPNCRTHLDISEYNICMHIWSWAPHLCATSQPSRLTSTSQSVDERTYKTWEPPKSPGRPSSYQESSATTWQPRETIQEKTLSRNILWHSCNCDIYLCYCVPLNYPWLTTGLFEIYLFAFYSFSILFSFKFCTRVKVV